MKNHHLAVLLGLSLFTASCSTQSKDTTESKDSIPTIPVTELKTQKTELHREYVGDIHAVKNVEIYARVKGYLEEVYVDEGKEVKKGQILFRINSEEYAAELAKAKANLQSAIADAKGAELELKRVKMLVEKNVISKTEVDVAKAKLCSRERQKLKKQNPKNQMRLFISRKLRSKLLSTV